MRRIGRRGGSGKRPRDGVGADGSWERLRPPSPLQSEDDRERYFHRDLSGFDATAIAVAEAEALYALARAIEAPWRTWWAERLAHVRAELRRRESSRRPWWWRP